MKRIILGIDPGSRITGYGLIESNGFRHRYLDSGCIRCVSQLFPQRLQEIFEGLQTIIHRYMPTEVAIEQVFVHLNVNAAFKLGQARGVALLATNLNGLQIAEYAARKVKQTVVGYGNADKQQVNHMVQHLLSLNGAPQQDAADALAIAICHAVNSGPLA